MAAMGATKLADIVGRRDLLERRPDLDGKAARIDVSTLIGAPPAPMRERRLDLQSVRHMPRMRTTECEAAERAIGGEAVHLEQRLTNRDRCVGVGAAGLIARRYGDAGLPNGSLAMRHRGAAGHFYGAYSVSGMTFHLEGVAADSCFTAAYGGRLVVIPQRGQRFAEPPTLVGNAFGYGARAGAAYIAGRAGNRFGICLRKSHEGTAPRIVVEGVEANGFQYMTGGVALVLGPTGFNLGSGMTGGVVYLLDIDPATINAKYVAASPLCGDDQILVRTLLQEHVDETGSALAIELVGTFDPGRFRRVATSLQPERFE
jgi:glutamate synthase domain-containing protein 3